MRSIAARALALLIAVASAGSALAQDWPAYFSDAAREPGTRILVWNPVAMDYEVITFEALLDGVIDFPDSLTRYVNASTTPGHTFAAADFTGGTATTSPNELTCAPYPTITDATAGWIAVAVPSSVGLPFLAIGTPFNTAVSQRNAFREQAGNPLQINGIDHDVFVSYVALNLSVPAQRTLCFRSDAVLP